jgi:hypothetical protein
MEFLGDEDVVRAFTLFLMIRYVIITLINEDHIQTTLQKLRKETK